MLRKNILALVCVLASTIVVAQNYFQVETDIMDPVTAKGGSLFLTHGFGKNAITIGAAINELPEFLNDESDLFTEKRNFQNTIEYGRFLKQSATGIYFGANVNYSNITIKELSTNAEEDHDVFRFGLVAGYIWMPWKGLTINPFINPRISTGFDDSEFASGSTYEGESLGFFGGLKLGWRFNLTNKNK